MRLLLGAAILAIVGGCGGGSSDPDDDPARADANPVAGAQGTGGRPGTADDEDERERRLAIDDAQQARADAGLEPMVVHVFDGAGHDLMRYQPDAVAGELGRLARP